MADDTEASYDDAWRLPSAAEVETQGPPTAIDTSVPHPARMYDYYLGGKDNFAADREAAQRVLELYPMTGENARVNRAFLRRAVRYVAGACGVRQFLDIGTGIPGAGNTHESAQSAAPEARVAYVDNDPIVHSHARALISGDPRGRTSFVLADLREPEKILQAPEVSAVIDFEAPVGVVLGAVLHFVADDDEPHDLVRRLLEPLAPGSRLILSHAVDQVRENRDETLQVYDRATAQPVPRTAEQIAAFFDGLELVDPGLVKAPLWRPEPHGPELTDDELGDIFVLAGVAWKR